MQMVFLLILQTMKVLRKIGFLALVLYMFTLGANAASFSDVPSDNENAVAINALADMGIVEGYENNTFEPNLFVNRAEALKLIMESAFTTIPDDIVRTFPDVDNTLWYAKYASLAKEQGIISGYPDGTFRGSTLVNYAEVLKITLRAFDIRPELLYDEASLQAAFPKYKSNEWFLPYLMYAKERNLPLLEEPAGFPTRAQMAELIYRMKMIEHFGLTSFNTEYSSLYYDLYKEGDRYSTNIEANVNTLLAKSPMLSGESLAAVVPYTFLDVTTHKDLLLEALADLSYEADLIHDFWQSGEGISDGDRNLLSGQLVSIKNNINTTKNTLLNNKTLNTVDGDNVKAALTDMRRKILTMYGESMVAIIKNVHQDKHILQVASGASQKEAYQSLIESLDTIVQRTGDITSLMEAQDGNMDGFSLLSEAVKKVHEVQLELTQAKDSITTLAKSL